MVVAPSWTLTARPRAECTFIVLDPLKPDTPGTGELGGAMVGDVNLFILDPGEAEVEVMIAESSARGKGIGRQAYVVNVACEQL